jgi:hypothetical protein
VPSADADSIAQLPTVAILFAAFLGYNPIKELLGDNLSTLPVDDQTTLVGLKFFPHLISDPFADGLAAAFTFAIVCCLVGAVASLFTGRKSDAAADDGEVIDRSPQSEAEQVPDKPVNHQVRQTL